MDHNKMSQVLPCVDNVHVVFYYCWMRWIEFFYYLYLRLIITNHKWYNIFTSFANKWRITQHSYIFFLHRQWISISNNNKKVTTTTQRTQHIISIKYLLIWMPAYHNNKCRTIVEDLFFLLLGGRRRRRWTFNRAFICDNNIVIMFIVEDRWIFNQTTFAVIRWTIVSSRRSVHRVGSLERVC